MAWGGKGLGGSKRRKGGQIGVDRERTERGMDGDRDEMVICGGGWGGMEMQHAEMGTKLRDREMRGGQTEIM